MILDKLNLIKTKILTFKSNLVKSKKLVKNLSKSNFS